MNARLSQLLAGCGGCRSGAILQQTYLSVLTQSPVVFAFYTSCPQPACLPAYAIAGVLPGGHQN